MTTGWRSFRAGLRSRLDFWRTSHARRALRASGPRLVILPSNPAWDPASNLRAYCVAPALARLGWRVLIIPPSLDIAQRRALIASEVPDVLLMQQTRHPLNQPHLYPAVPSVLDVDDADFLDCRHAERIAKCAADAAAIVAGSRFVADHLARFGTPAHVVWTCTPTPSTPPDEPPHGRPPIVAWAHGSPFKYPAEARLVSEVMCQLARTTSCQFWLFGTDEAEAEPYLAPIRRAGAACRALPPMNYAAYMRATSKCAVGLQPVCLDSPFSQGKSFGKVLAYLAGQVAVVASDAVDHPLLFRNGVNGYLCPNEVDAWVAAAAKLLADPGHRETVALAGYEEFCARLTTDTHARLLDRILRDNVRPSRIGVESPTARR